MTSFSRFTTRSPGQAPGWRVVDTQMLSPEEKPDADEHTPVRSAGVPSTTTGIDPRRKALELLTRREHSQRELTQKLVQRGVDAGMAHTVVAELQAAGWQNETRFAEALARTRCLAGYGPLRIRAELQQHGIAGEIIAQALDACEVDWTAQACDVLQRRFGSKAAGNRKEIARQGAFLQRRGFDLDAIRHALSSLEE